MVMGIMDRGSIFSSYLWREMVSLFSQKKLSLVLLKHNHIYLAVAPCMHKCDHLKSIAILSEFTNTFRCTGHYLWRGRKGKKIKKMGGESRVF